MDYSGVIPYNMIWEEKNLTEPEKNSLNNTEPVKDATIQKIGNNLMSNDLNATSPKKISGIYKIINKVNGKYYVGSSINIYRRWSMHKSWLNRNKHHNYHLQLSWNKYGQQNFDFIIEKEVPPETLLKVEDEYLLLAKKEASYNLNFNATGSDVSNSTRSILSQKGKERWLNQQYRETQTLKITQAMNKPEVKLRASNLTKATMTPARKLQLSFFANVPRNLNKINLFTKFTQEIFEGTQWECRKKYSLNASHLSGLIQGKRLSHKGWILFKNRFNKYVLENQLGIKSLTKIKLTNSISQEMFEGTRDEFKKRYKISKSNANNLINKKIKSHKGWRLASI